MQPDIQEGHYLEYALSLEANRVRLTRAGPRLSYTSRGLAHMIALPGPKSRILVLFAVGIDRRLGHCEESLTAENAEDAEDFSINKDFVC